MSGEARDVRLELSGGRVFEAIVGDLLAQKVDAIVNAANGRLAHGGGVAAAIARAAGRALTEEGDRLVAERGPVPTGEAVVTGAGRLAFRGVVHAVGPMQGEADEERKLVSALGSAFARAAERGWRSIAFPAVSSGIFAVPLPTCARAYVRAVREHVASRPDTSLQLFRLCVFDPKLVDLVRAEAESRRPA